MVVYNLCYKYVLNKLMIMDNMLHLKLNIISKIIIYLFLLNIKL